QPQKLGVGNINMRADELYPLPNLFPYGGHGPFFRIRSRLRLFDLMPAGYPFEKRPRFNLPTITSAGINIVQVQVGVDIGWQHQFTTQIDLFLTFWQI